MEYSSGLEKARHEVLERSSRRCSKYCSQPGEPSPRLWERPPRRSRRSGWEQRGGGGAGTADAAGGGAGALHGLRGETHSLGLLAGRLLRVPSFLPRTAFRLGVEEASSFSSRAAAIPTQAGSFTGF